MRLDIPDFALVVLIGASGAGKSTFADRHFAPTEVQSSDAFRALVADDPTDLSATPDAFALLHDVCRRRLARRRLTVVDATNVRRDDRAGLVALAREAHALPVAIVLDLPVAECRARNRSRSDRPNDGAHVDRQVRSLRAGLGRDAARALRREGFSTAHVLEGSAAVDQAQVHRVPLWVDRRQERGPFDVIGDVHGCLDELLDLLEVLGWRAEPHDGGWRVSHPHGRKLVFVGDLVDRGPRSREVVRLVSGAVLAGVALAVAGNHDVKAARHLRGQTVSVAHGLEATALSYEAADDREKAADAAFLNGLVSHYALDGGALVVAHAGLPEGMQNRASPVIRTFCLYGDTTGEIDGFGLPVRQDWAAGYRGAACVVHGHVPVAEPQWTNNVLNIDTGCVFGGRLTAFRWPERDIRSVPARRTYVEPVRPSGAGANVGDTRPDGGVGGVSLPTPVDLLGRRRIGTELAGPVPITEAEAAAAFSDLMTRGEDLRWLIYLPPTMAPVDTSVRENLLEHPDEAMEHYAARGVERLVVQEKHMGSRAVAVVCRDHEGAARRFGTTTDGALFTRYGRPFGAGDGIDARAILAALRQAATEAGLWEELSTDWLVLDGELLPWSAKAMGLIRTQFAATTAAGRLGCQLALSAAQATAGRGVEHAGAIATTLNLRCDALEAFARAYRPYVELPDAGAVDVRFAPFHLLASEGAVHDDKTNLWHMAMAGRLAAASGTGPGPRIVVTGHRVVDLSDPGSRAAATAWWEELTAAGVEGCVVKPERFVQRDRKGRILQPALKVRGPEYLRIVYGPDYRLPANLMRLRERAVGARRSMALKEFALGIEALQRFVRGEPVARWTECVLGVLALESEASDRTL